MQHNHHLLKSEQDHILIAEDNHDFADILLQHTSSLGYDVSAVENTILRLSSSSRGTSTCCRGSLHAGWNRSRYT